MRSRVRRVRGSTQSRAGGLMREADAVLHNTLSNSYDSISHLSGGASNSDSMQSCGANMRGDGNLHMGKVMDLAQTCTSTANDVASNGIWNSKSRSDVGLVHGGDMVDCLLGVACRCQHSVGVQGMSETGNVLCPGTHRALMYLQNGHSRG